VVAPLGVTMMSAGSHTEPGGYTGQGRDAVHLTVRGKPVDGSGTGPATEQFAISDTRSASAMKNALENLGLEPVWKDWDAGILGAA
jgi:2-iminoacetate synthase